MRSVCILVALFAGACCLPVISSSGGCVYPPRWESFLAERMRTKMTASGTETTMAVMGNMYADYNAKKAAIHFTIYQEAPYQVSAIADWEASAIFAFYPDTGRCVRSALSGSMVEQGVPPNASHLSSFRWGHGHNAVTVDQWKSTVNYEKPWPSRVELFQMVTTDECVPVVEQGTNHVPGAEVAFDVSFANFNTTITNPLAFNPPDYCADAPVVDTPGPLVQGLMMRFMFTSS
ncbi:hypothetical protein CAPTEDRAFT_226097 [Capitella teleta]|uniref:Mammalian ependymin-related protein 1 n=1 Tax=Capitella teleta TaxID=283909 RepID=R7UYA9_CAPTE|nr:hypothetical protein CAPTEDRAFT_226097 [Capitella teleta]|eukprot:ELU11294.1 hypothetical protein CAPTEDRAFT_226097 [Capitella teleta]